MNDFNEIVNKAISHKASIDSSLRDIRDNNIMIQQEQDKLDKLIANNKTTKFSYAYLDALVKEESGKFIKRLNEILDYGVKTIFYDCDYSVDVRVTDNNKATIHLIYEDEDGNKVEPDVQNCGGGIRTCIGFLMQIFFVFLYKAEPIIFVDEGFSQLSAQYLPGFFSLIDELAQKNGLKILLITHDEKLVKYGKTHVMIKDGYSKIVESEEEDDSVEKVVMSDDTVTT